MSISKYLAMGIRRLLWIAPAALLVGTIIAITVFLNKNKEDPRTTSDKEGRYIPGFCLKELALAMHGYNDKHGHLPPAALCSDNGKPLLSWRVLLLPFLEQEELFRQFKLDEPWDSKHNLALLPKIPYVYAPLDGNPPLERYTTLFQVFVGKGTAFESCKGLRLRHDFPRPGHTILIVEAGKSVPWTKPDDLLYDENRPLPKLGGFFKGYFFVALADCSVASFRGDVERSTFRDAILRNNQGKWPSY